MPVAERVAILRGGVDCGGSDSFGSDGSLDSDGSLGIGSGATSIWPRFLRKDPDSVSTTYDLGVSLVDTTLPGIGWCSEVTQTSESSGMGSSSFTR